MLYYKTYESDPSNEWVVFFHGLGGSHSIFFRQLREFRKHFNLLLIDFPGHGKSQNILKGHTYTYEKVVNEVIKVLNHLHIQSAHFVGISLGTIILNAFLKMAPERISSVVMGGAVLKWSPLSRFLGAVGNVTKHITPYMWLYQLFAWILMPKKHHSEARLTFVQEAVKLGRSEFLRWYKLGLGFEDTYTKIKGGGIAIPILYIMGSEDYMFLDPVMEAAKENPHAALHIIPHCGHVCNIEQPNEFNQVALSFLKRQSPHTS